MVTRWSHVSLILALIACCVTSGHTSCSDAQVAECMRPLKDVQHDFDASIVPTMDVAQLRRHCVLYDVFSDCMDPVRPHCDILHRKVYEGMDDSFEFVCGEGFKDYIKFRECFIQPELHYEGQTCNTTFDLKLHRLALYKDTKSLEYRRDRLCQYSEDYLDCVENAVTSFCGPSAATWQRTVDEKSLSPLLDSVNCPGRGLTAATWPYVVAGVLVGVTVIIITVSIVVILRARQKKARPRRAQDVPSEIYPQGAPPPYDGPCVVYNSSEFASAGGATGQPIPEKLKPPPYENANEAKIPPYHQGDAPQQSAPFSGDYFGAPPGTVAPPVLPAAAVAASPPRPLLPNPIPGPGVRQGPEPAHDMYNDAFSLPVDTADTNLTRSM